MALTWFMIIGMAAIIVIGGSATLYFSFGWEAVRDYLEIAGWLLLGTSGFAAVIGLLYWVGTSIGLT